MLRGFLCIAGRMVVDRRTRWPYLKNFFRAAMMGPTKFEYAHTIMGSYLHFDMQSQKILEALEVSIDFAEHHAGYPRSVTEMHAMSAELGLPVVNP